MAAGALGNLTLPRPRLDLAIASSRRSPLSIRGGELGLGFGPLPKFSGLRFSRRLQKVWSASGAANSKADRGSSVACELPETATEVPDVTKESWQSHIMECGRPVVVEFWAPWCGPCHMIHPVVAKVIKTYEGKLECFKINTDECPDLVSQYGVRSIPTIILFKNGEKKDAIIGAVPESTLISCIDKFLGR